MTGRRKLSAVDLLKKDNAALEEKVRRLAVALRAAYPFASDDVLDSIVERANGGEVITAKVPAEVAERLELEAENRRQFLKTLSPGARKIAEDSFRGLGLRW